MPGLGELKHPPLIRTRIRGPPWNARICNMFLKLLFEKYSFG
jgi:hypothetical protein